MGTLAPYGDVLQTLRLNLIGWTVTPNRPALFRGRHLEDAIILRCVRSYLRYSLRYRDLEEMMAERGLSFGRRHDLTLGPALCSHFESTVSL